MKNFGPRCFLNWIQPHPVLRICAADMNSCRASCSWSYKPWRPEAIPHNSCQLVMLFPITLAFCYNLSILCWWTWGVRAGKFYALLTKLHLIQSRPGVFQQVRVIPSSLAENNEHAELALQQNPPAQVQVQVQLQLSSIFKSFKPCWL